MKLLDKNKLELNIEKIAKYDLDNNNVFGCSYFVWQDGNELFKKHFGYSNFENSAQVDDSTIYRLASMTKPITAFAVLILVDRGLISLDDEVQEYIPQFKDIHVINPEGDDLGITKKPVTVLHCLTHTSGLGCSKKVVEMTDDDRKNISSSIDCFVKAGLAFEPFTMQSYSACAAFDVLAAIVEKVTGQEYKSFLESEIFIPCNMPDTTFIPSENQWKRFITMHNKVDEKNTIGSTYPNCVFERYPCEHMVAGAGLASTLNDYSNFARMLLNKGKINDVQLVSEQTFSKFSTPYVPELIMSGNQNWGLGVRVVTRDDYKYLSVGSFGWSGAYGSHFWVDPQNDICAVFMKNSRFDGGSGNCSARRFEEAVFDSLIK